MPKASSSRLTPMEVQKVLTAVRSARHGVRDYAMLLTLYHHGLRVSELCRLTQADLDLEGRMIWIERLKGGRSGAHPVPENEAQALGEYLEERKTEGTLALPALFLNERGAPLSRNAVYYLIRRAGEMAEIGRPLYPHLFRHAAGYKLAGDGHDVKLIQDYLGLRSARSALRFVSPQAETGSGDERFAGLWTES
ncbi:MAG: tyrosine-type recombinase/integrase [Acidobacteria bacterium]|nr:tyrosine-type recombinase/integrase [Acidobacteriota bacterium]